MARILGRDLRRPVTRDNAARSPFGLGLNSIIPRRLRRLGCFLGGIFGKSERQPVYEPDISRLAELVSHVPGSSWIWCGGCGSMMAPVVLGDEEQTRIVAVGCRACGIGLPVALGLLIGGEPASGTLH